MGVLTLSLPSDMTLNEQALHSWFCSLFNTEVMIEPTYRADVWMAKNNMYKALSTVSPTKCPAGVCYINYQ